MPADDEILLTENQETTREFILESHSWLRDKVIESNWRLTQQTFLSNAGGAAAVLGYMGSAEPGSWAIFPLVFFALGIVTSAIEVRALLHTYALLHNSTTQVLDRILGRDFSLKDTKLNTKKSKFAGNINLYAGMASQVFFVLGVGVGGYFYACAP